MSATLRVKEIGKHQVAKCFTDLTRCYLKTPNLPLSALGYCIIRTQ